MKRRRNVNLSIEEEKLEIARELARLDRRPWRDQLAWVIEEWVGREQHRLPVAATGPDGAAAEPPAADGLTAAIAVG